MSTSGSIQQCQVDGRRFSVATDADADRDLGGFTNEVQANGDGTARYVKTRKPWKLSGVAISVDDNRGDLEYLQEKADSLEPYPITITLVNGRTYGGVGMISGDLSSKTMAGTVDVEFSGEDKLEPQ